MALSPLSITPIVPALRAAFIPTLLVGLIAMAAACGPGYVDDDKEYRDARRVPDQMLVHDRVDTDQGDLMDWKTLTPREAGTITLTVKVGDVFKGRHGLTGEMAIFTTDAKQLKSMQITPTQVPYEFIFEADAATTYLLRVQAFEGAADYAVSYTQVVEVADPCDGVDCNDDSRCEEGRCVVVRVAVPDEPEPDVGPCGGPCDKGEICSKYKKRCVKNPCYGKKCGSGKYCKNGVCKTKKKPVVVSRGCDPSCGKGEVCKKKKCVKESPGSVRAQIIQVQPRAGTDSSYLTLDKGKSHGVRKGASGSIRGVGSFKIIEVYNMRSKGLIKKKPAEVKVRSATIKL